MQTSLYDLEAAEVHWHELQAEAAHERQAKAAMKLHPERSFRALLVRSLELIRTRGADKATHDPRNN
jgi:hypothetical protein